MRVMTRLPATQRRKAVLAVVLAAAVLGACTSPPTVAPAPTVPTTPAVPAPAAAASSPGAAALPRYRCDQGIAFTVRQGEDSVTIDAGARGRHVLLRDAGGVTPRHTVYSNDGVKAEFGLGAAGDEAILRYQEPPLVARCQRE